MSSYFSEAYGSIRWRIGLLMFLGVAINYLDRINISHAIVSISDEFRLSNIEKGWILSAFSIGYVIFMTLGGYCVYKHGPNITLTISTALLSICTCLAGFSSNFITLFSTRFFIGMFEAPTFPANAYSVSRWFPKQERGKATSLFDAGSYVGSALAAPLIIFVIATWGWRMCFLISGFIGMLWTLVWSRYFVDEPSKHKHISAAEVNHIDTIVSEEESKIQKISWMSLLGNRKVIGLSIGFFCYNYIKSFHLTWFPIFLIEEKSVDFLKLSYLGAVPPLFAVIGEVLTGSAVDRLAAKGYSSLLIKKISISLGFILSSVIVVTLFVDNIVAVILLISFSYMSIISSSVGIWSIPDDLVTDKRNVAILGSIQNTFANMAGIIAPVVIGYAYEYTHSFTLPFFISVLVTLLGVAAYWLLVDNSDIIDI